MQHKIIFIRLWNLLKSICYHEKLTYPIPWSSSSHRVWLSLTNDISLQVLRKHGFRPTEQELTAMIRNVDKSTGDGGIDFEEFIELMVKHGSNIDEDIVHSFNVFDRNGDGLITEDELHITMNNLGEPMNEDEVKAMIAEADLDGDGKINLREFKLLMDSKAI